MVIYPAQKAKGSSSRTDLTYGSRIEQCLVQLAEINHLKRDTEQIIQHFRLLAEHSFSKDCAIGETSSALCGDGQPFEYSISVGGDGALGLRYVIDVGASLQTRSTRLAECQKKTTMILKHLGQDKHIKIANQIITDLIPMQLAVKRSRFFGVWHGLSYSQSQSPVLKIYHNLRLWNLPVAWTKLNKILEILGIKNTMFLSLCEWFEKEHFTPAFIGIEYHSHGMPKPKVYFRGKNLTYSQVVRLLKRCGFEASIPSYNIFHNMLIGDHEKYLPRSWVLCFNVNRKGSLAVEGIKLELAARRYFHNDCDVYQAINRLFQEFKLDMTPYLDIISILNPKTLSSKNVSIHNVVSLGISLKKGTRLNVYFGGGAFNEKH